ncbi:MAG: hypothetical protein KatS3mg068_0955 [Candidatus Sericytochromatia bacterium]|nr:MAG: hypothetical protein KatS3mg068_0955 [Candidatus Sericytochromatia bacterium]
MKKLIKFGILSFLLTQSLSACNSSSINDLTNSIDIVSTQSNSIEEAKSNKFNTAKEQLWRVESVAKRWDISAELVKVEGRDVTEDGSSRWVFYFKSPFKRNALMIDSFYNSREVLNNFFGREIREYDWRIDSNEAIKLAQKQGLKKLPVLEMKLESRFDLEWELRTFNGIFTINANTGKLSKK